MSGPVDDFHLQVSLWFAFAYHLQVPETLRALFGAHKKIATLLSVATVYSMEVCEDVRE